MYRFSFVLLICILVAAAGSPAIAGADTPSVQPSVVTPLWTSWGAEQYALADDGAAIWIGGAGSILRYDKQSHTFKRYSRLDGLPHTHVLAIAVDADGNRWFGGDGGLSRFDPAEHWTHFRQTPGGLHSDLVDGIAIVGGHTLYASHGLPSGPVSRRDAGGTWSWFANREAAIQADYAAIVQTPGSTPLWTVAGNEVWAGVRVFDGAAWHERPLPTSYYPTNELISLAVDSRGYVWALGHNNYVYEWDGSSWVPHDPFQGSYYYDAVLETLAIDQSDTVWLGSRELPGAHPYSNMYAAVRRLDGTRHLLAAAGPVVALLPTDEGMWALGPGWLMQPDFSLAVVNDAPRFAVLPDAAVAADGSLWLYSGYQAPYTLGAVQSLDDQGTLRLADDDWQVRPADYQPYTGYCERVTAFERAPGGIWYANYCFARFPGDSKVVRYRNGERIEYDISPGPTWFTQQVVSDIFSQDDRHTWFAISDPEEARIVGLDDRGTPADTTDDSLRTVPIGPTNEKVWVAVDAAGALWHGRASGLYRYTGSTWQRVYAERPVCDLVPAADGTLYAQVAAYGQTECERSDRILIVHPDGTIAGYALSVDVLAETEFDRVRTAQRRNNLWAIGPDSAVWYIDRSAGVLLRRTAARVTGYSLPVNAAGLPRVEVDLSGHVWLVDGTRLWRMEGPAPQHLYLPLAGK